MDNEGSCVICLKANSKATADPPICLYCRTAECSCEIKHQVCNNCAVEWHAYLQNSDSPATPPPLEQLETQLAPNTSYHRYRDGGSEDEGDESDKSLLGVQCCALLLVVIGVVVIYNVL